MTSIKSSKKLLPEPKTSSFERKLFIKLISKCKNSFLYPIRHHKETILEHNNKPYQLPFDVFETYAQYQTTLNQHNLLDFDDLIALPVFLAKHSSEFQQYLQRFKYVLVDEYQDTNLTQETLLEHFIKQGSICTAVGDDAQSIYGFRGAHLNNILGYKKKYPAVQLIKLEQNYRSTKTILDLANDVIRHNKQVYPKKLFNNIREDFPIEMLYFPYYEEEANTIIDTIIQMIDSGTNPEEIAIFFRTNAQTHPYEDILIRKNISYRLLGGFKFFDRKEVKEVIAYIHLSINSKDNCFPIQGHQYPYKRHWCCLLRTNHRLYPTKQSRHSPCALLKRTATYIAQKSTKKYPTISRSAPTDNKTSPNHISLPLHRTSSQ